VFANMLTRYWCVENVYKHARRVKSCLLMVNDRAKTILIMFANIPGMFINTFRD
jgi:hypothetical protein